VRRLRNHGKNLKIEIEPPKPQEDQEAVPEAAKSLQAPLDGDKNGFQSSQDATLEMREETFIPP